MAFFPTAELNGIKTTIIHPATEKHIVKFSAQNVYLVDETIDIYRTITLPYIEKEQFSLQWLYNILDHTSESERIIFEDPDPDTGFILLPDLKWDGKTLETLYLLALVHPKDIRSLRDLTGNHIPLLKNIFDKGTKAIEDKYGLNKSQLRIYLHYQPSFYHLHVHFTYLKHDAPVLRIQLNLIGGYLYKDTKAITSTLQQNYLSMCHLLLETGVQKITTVINEKITDIMSTMDLKKKLSLYDVEQIFWNLQVKLCETENDPIKHVRQYVIPEEISESTDLYDSMVRETADLLDSEEVQSLATTLVILIGWTLDLAFLASAKSIV
ncbi:uncharacterized protein CBL_03363 [Carabus blaptoides fortunei]